MGADRPCQPNDIGILPGLFGGLFLLAATVYRREHRRPAAGHLTLGWLCGLFLALDLNLFHYSIHLIGPGLGTILPNFQVFILTAWGILFGGERIRLIFIVAVPMAILGLVMIVGVDWQVLAPSYRIGIYCGLAAAAVYAGFLLFLRKFQAEQGGLSIFYAMMMVSWTSAAFLGIEVVRTGDTFVIPDLQSGLAVVCLALFSQCIGWILITNALPVLPPSLAGLLLLLQPALAFVWDVLLFQRTTTSVNWLGVLMVLTAIYWGAFRPVTNNSE